MREGSAKGFVISTDEPRSVVTQGSYRNGARLEMPPIAIGSRFRMTALGAARCPRHAQKEGTIVGASRLNSSVRVLFDGYKSPVSLHRDYIQQVPSESK